MTECIQTISESPCEGEEPFLTIHGVPVYFDEDWQAGIGGGLWSTGLALAKYFQSSAMDVRRSLRRLSSKKLSVLELGSGNGFLSMCFLALARDLIGELTITDTGDDHLKLMQDTLAKNSHIVQDMANNVRPKISVLEHRWGEFLDDNNSDDNKNNNNNDAMKSITNDDNDTAEASKITTACSPTSTVMNSNRKFDFIFGSDLAYREELYSPLISTLEKFCHSKTVFLLGITMHDTKPKFFHMLKEAGFRYERLGDHLMEAEFRGTTFGLFMIYKRDKM